MIREGFTVVEAAEIGIAVTAARIDMLAQVKKNKQMTHDAFDDRR